MDNSTIKKQPSLFWLMYKKDGVHWRRMKDLFKEMDDIGSMFISYPIILVLISVIHYAFALMHFFFELSMYIFARDRFKMNMTNLTDKLIKQNLIKTQNGKRKI
jgi:hypothetical protein